MKHRLAILVSFALASGCSAGGGEAVLFADDFSGATFPGPNWVGDGMVSTTAGAPAPGLYLAAAPPLASTSVQMANPVDVSGGIVLRFEAANGAAAPTSDLNLFDVNENDNVAYVEFRQSQVRLHITGATSTVLPINPDTLFHSYELRIGSSGATSWWRDGNLQLEGQLAFAPTLARLIVRADVNGVFLDEIEIRER